MNEHKPEHYEMGFISVAAHRKLARADGFQVFRSEAIEGGFLVTGCVPSGVYSKGVRKGRPKYDGPRTQVLVTREDVDSAAAEYERETGFCSYCLGSGSRVRGWSIEKGTTRSTCCHCGGSGSKLAESKP